MSEHFNQFITRVRESGFTHHTIEAEQQIRHLLIHGEKAQIRRLFENIDGQLGILAQNPVRSTKNMIIGINFLYCRIAIEHHVDSEYAFLLSDYYINQAEELEDLTSLKQLMLQCTMHYADLIAQNKPLPYALPVNRAILFIKRNLYNKISVQEIASYLQLNPRYLSTLFKQETGTALHDYISQRKMEEAQNLLSYTNQSLTDIAQALGYHDPSHFTKVFKKYVGMLPKHFSRDTGVTLA